MAPGAKPPAEPGGSAVFWKFPPEAPLVGHVLLDRPVGAEIRLITPDTYRERAAVMAEAAAEIRAEGGRPYVIPEGGSNGVDALRYVRAMEEVRRAAREGQAVRRHRARVRLGGTAVGVALDPARYEVAGEVRAMTVCDDEPTFERTTQRIIDEARALEAQLGAPARLVGRPSLACLMSDV